MRHLACGLLTAAAACAQTMDVHVNQSGAFSARPDGGGIITGVVDLRTTVQFPESRTVVIGGDTRGTGGTSSSSSGPLGRSETTSMGGGNLVTVTVREVPVITGPRAYALDGAPGHRLVELLASESADDRLSSITEIGRRCWPDRARSAGRAAGGSPPERATSDPPAAWSPRARTALTRRISSRLGDTSPTVAGAAARCIADLGDPEAAGHLLGYLRGADAGRLVPLIEALGRVGDAKARAPLARFADSIDLEISNAARRALAALDRRAQLPAARSKSPGTNR